MNLARWGCAFALAWPLFAAAQVAVLSVSTTELSAARGDKARYVVRADQPGDLALQLLSGDGDVVREFQRKGVAPGEHAFEWDGRDELGQPLPDEAYAPRATLQAATGVHVDDRLKASGGEAIAKLDTTVSAAGDIAYTLPAPARVLVRVGVKGGAMLRSLSVWKPHPAGRNLQRWNGYDETGRFDLRTPRLSVLVAAFRLPDHAVLTSGHPELDYRAYRRARGWPEAADPGPQADAQPLERGGVRIARQLYMPRYKDREPRITVELADTSGRPLAPGAALPDAVRVTVDLHPDDRWLMQESLYEVAFFVDGDFVSEEENGYVPIAWIWNTTQLAKGSHMLSVNLTGFTGRVGTHSQQLAR